MELLIMVIFFLVPCFAILAIWTGLSSKDSKEENSPPLDTQQKGRSQSHNSDQSKSELTQTIPQTKAALREEWKEQLKQRTMQRNETQCIEGITEVHCSQYSSSDLKEQTLFCKYCGSKIDSDSVFCSKCGSKISSEAHQIPIPSPATKAVERSPEPNNTVPLSWQQERTKCPKCGGAIAYQTVSESNNGGCFTAIWYLILALTIWGLLIVIPLMLRKKTKTVTYAVCQNCGHRWPIKRY